MTNADIIIAYLRHSGRVVPENAILNGTLLLLLPWFVMDISYQIYCQDVRDVLCHHKMKQLKTAWRDNYNKFNGRFFSSFNEEQTEAVVDAMEDMEQFISNDLMTARSVIMKEFYEEDFWTKKIISSVMICNILTQAANIIYRETSSERRNNHNLDAIRHITERFMNGIPRVGRDKVNLNLVDAVNKSVNILQDRMLAWAKQYHIEK